LVPAAALLVHYATLQWMLRLKSRPARVGLYWAWLLGTLSGFVLVKQYFWITDIFVPRDFLSSSLITVGISFMLFRQIHLAIEVRDELVTSVRVVDYLNYNLAFWTFLAGPVQRFDSFCEQFRKITAPDGIVSSREVLLGLNRATFGFIKMFVVGPAIENLSSWLPSLQHGLGHGVVSLLAFPAHLYINFSGYCDIMIGLAQAVGFQLPENFQHPYLARNPLDYWRRWNITVTEFFRDYLYFPFYTLMGRRMPIVLSMIVAALFSFTVMGAWHGNSLRFVIFGVVHGLGVGVLILYETVLKKLLTKEQLNRYGRNPLIHVAAVVCFQTFNLLSFLPFQYEVDQLRSMIHSAARGMAGMG
jgi:D-alanyl-lipoteichoic acid acyltransferase DltB (MBOAT superfamily)